MSLYVYRQFINSRKEDKAHEYHYASQDKYEKTKNTIMYFSLFGGAVILAVIGAVYGETASSLCGSVGVVSYILGYHYCKVHWDKEKDRTEFNEALEEYEKKHPKQKRKKKPSTRTVNSGATK